MERDRVILQQRRLHYLDSAVLPQDEAQPSHLSVQVRRENYHLGKCRKTQTMSSQKVEIIKDSVKEQSI